MHQLIHKLLWYCFCAHVLRNAPAEDYEASVMIENPLTEPPEAPVPHNTSPTGVQYGMCTKVKSTKE